MSYDQKVQSARQIIDEHNANVKKQVVFDDFIEKLMEMGGSSEDALKAVSWEDLQDCGLPKIMARRLAFVFRKDSKDKNSKSVYVSDRKAKMMTIKELLERYDSKDVKNAIALRLLEISNNKPCIIFLQDGKVNVEASKDAISAIQQGFDAVNKINIEGIPHKVFKVGVAIDVYADTNPLTNTPLRPGEICAETGRPWKNISIIVRQIIYIANHITGELIVDGNDNLLRIIHDVMDLAVGKNAEKVFRQRYPNASLYYDDHKKIGDLPKLKIKLGENSGCNSKSNNPFGSNATY